MRAIMVGSVPALEYGIICKRKPKDMDIVGDWESALEISRRQGFPIEIRTVPSKSSIALLTEVGIVEVELVERRKHTQDLYNAMLKDSKQEIDGIPVASPEWLLFMKMSHRYKKDSPYFIKTMMDINDMRDRGIKLPIGSEELMKEREKLTYTNSLPKLNQSKDEFFNPNESFYKYEHDDLHKAVAIDSTPAYTKYSVEGEEVMSSKDKFFAQEDFVKALGVYEEACVLALERSQIPSDFKADPVKSFNMALEKVCTSITSGWFREYAYDNYRLVQGIYRRIGPNDYIKRFKKALDRGEVSLYNPESK